MRETSIGAARTARNHATAGRAHPVARATLGAPAFRATSLSGGDSGDGTGVVMVSGGFSFSAVFWTGDSTEARNARPRSVICQPSSSRKTND
jgi:hypothetical protein